MKTEITFGVKKFNPAAQCGHIGKTKEKTSADAALSKIRVDEYDANMPESATTKKAILELSLLSVLVSLVLKGTMDSLFAKEIIEDPKLTHVVQIVWTATLFQFSVFFFTLIRFMFGAYRFHESEPPLKHPFFLLWNTIGMLILFVLFYFTGLTIRNSMSFYALSLVIHIWDFIWFTPLVFALNGDLKTLVGRFMILDTATVLVLGLFLWCRYFHSGPNTLLWRGGAALFSIGIFDFVWNRRFYFSMKHQDS